MRPAKAVYQTDNGYSDGKAHFSIATSKDQAKRLTDRLHLENRLNRTQWIVEAIEEKLSKPARVS